jgi:hypothetical protein
MVKNLSLVPFWRWALVLALLFTLGVFIVGALLRFWRAHRPPMRAVFWTVGAFIAGIVATAFGPSLVNTALSKIILPEHRWEVARVASPDGTVDAVMVGSGCGPLCADTYLVTVVPKGSKVPTDVERYAFSGDDMVDAQLHWKQPNLLEIAYKKARINDFRNVSYPFAKFGDQESWKYKVELRLAPSSEGFSYLQDAAQ